MKKKQQKKYEEFVEEQFRILQHHTSNLLQRCINKYHQLESDSTKCRIAKGGKNE